MKWVHDENNEIQKIIIYNIYTLLNNNFMEHILAIILFPSCSTPYLNDLFDQLLFSKVL